MTIDQDKFEAAKGEAMAGLDAWSKMENKEYVQYALDTVLVRLLCRVGLGDVAERYEQVKKWAHTPSSKLE